MFSFISRRGDQQPSNEESERAMGKVDESEEAVNASQIDVAKVVDEHKESSGPEVPEHIFVEYEKPTNKPPMETNETPMQVNNLQTLYQHLAQNLEKKGYEDALMNPDSSYMQEQIRYIQNELNLLISKVNSYYSGFLRQIDFHIDTRKRSGMIETVEELIAHKATIEDEMKIVSDIELAAENGNGVTENLFLSYKKGFKNGLAAITFNTVLNRNGKS